MTTDNIHPDTCAAGQSNAVTPMYSDVFMRLHANVTLHEHAVLLIKPSVDFTETHGLQPSMCERLCGSVQ